MNRMYFTAKEKRDAAKRGGNVAGKYLESIGVFSLDKLSPEQWENFCTKLCEEYERHIDKCIDDEIPF